MRKKIAGVLTFAMLSVLLVGSPALAHDAGPCTQSADPGHSEYARHHVVPVVPETGHNPGQHQGFSICDPSNL